MSTREISVFFYLIRVRVGELTGIQDGWKDKTLSNFPKVSTPKFFNSDSDRNCFPGTLKYDDGPLRTSTQIVRGATKRHVEEGIALFLSPVSRCKGDGVSCCSRCTQNFSATAHYFPPPLAHRGIGVKAARIGCLDTEVIPPTPCTPRGAFSRRLS